MSARGLLHASSRQVLVDVLRVARGAVIGQAPFVLATPLITRLYHAGQLGIYGLALAFVGVVTPVMGLRFELAAISARDPDDARALLTLSAVAIVPVSAVCAVALCGLKILAVGSYSSLSWGIVIVTCVTIAAAGAYSTLRCWLVRRHRFALVANSLTVQGCVRAGMAVLMAPLGAGAALLVIAELVSRLSATGLMALRGGLSGWLSRPALLPHMLWQRAKKFWKYPLLLGPSALIDAAATSLPVPILATYYGLAAAGKFALVQRIVMLPAALIVSSVGDVFHAHAATIVGQDSNSVGSFLATTAARLLLLALAVYVPIALVAPFAARWVFGAQWADAGPMIALLAPLCVAQTIVSPISRGLLLAEREERKLIADVACLVLPIATLYVLRKNSMYVAIAGFSAASVIAFVIYYVVIVTALEAPLRNAPKLRS